MDHQEYADDTGLYTSVSPTMDESLQEMLFTSKPDAPGGGGQTPGFLKKQNTAVRNPHAGQKSHDCQNHGGQKKYFLPSLFKSLVFQLGG